jgi:hypothetical protein
MVRSAKNRQRDGVTMVRGGIGLPIVCLDDLPTDFRTEMVSIAEADHHILIPIIAPTVVTRPGLGMAR